MQGGLFCQLSARLKKKLEFYSMSFILSFILLLSALTHTGFCFRHYQDRIPNGGKVTHPCDAGQIWHGVGHENMQGGGANNQFGKEFIANGYKWTKQFCQSDTDGDNKTNGEELGDPECSWVQGQEPSRKVNITHPGVCDPVDSAVCKDKNDTTCTHASKFNCPWVDNGSDVRRMEMRLNETRVPAQETTYICQFYEFPDDHTYDIIGSEPIIDNNDVMHHIVVWGCKDDKSGEAYRSPKYCDMGVRGCSTFLFLWTLGSLGNCFGKDIGLRIGKQGWKYVIFQTHWNNPQLANHFTDSSGMNIYYTPSLRKNAEASMILGVIDFKIPPGLPSHVETATLSEECSYLRQPFTLYLHSVYLHMHYLGKSAKLEVYRHGRKIQDAAVDKVYTYDRPVFHQIEPAVEYRQGDELKLTCEFDSTGRTNVTKFGEATADEMCYAFISFTPFTVRMQNMVSIRNLIELCTVNTPANGGAKGQMGFVQGTRCHMTSYRQGERPKFLRRISEHCNTSDAECSEDCIRHLKSMKNNPCHDESVPGLVDFIKERIVIHDKDKSQAKFAERKMRECAHHLVEKPTGRPGDYERPCVAAGSTRITLSIACVALAFLNFWFM